MSDTKEHWENVFDTKKVNEVSWFQENPETSVELIASAGLGNGARIIDVGGGDSNLVDKLLDLGFENISMLDVSAKALEKAKQRIGEKAKAVKWVCSDIREFETDDRFDVWHDRALFHFLTSKKDIEKYVELVEKYLKTGGYLIVGTFSLKGPEKCSGLNVMRYSESSMKDVFAEGFEHIKSLEETHQTPFKTTQNFIWNVFKKIGMKGGTKSESYSL